VGVTHGVTKYILYILNIFRYLFLVWFVRLIKVAWNLFHFCICQIAAD